MKRIAICLSLLFTTTLMFSCEKEIDSNNQVEEGRVSSSNLDETYVQHPETSEWITLTEYNNLYPNADRAQNYSKRLCIIVDDNGNEKNGEVCARDSGSNCPSQGLCITK